MSKKKNKYHEIKLLPFEAVNAPPFVWRGYVVLVPQCEHGVTAWYWCHIKDDRAKKWLHHARHPMVFNTIKDELWELINES